MSIALAVIGIYLVYRGIRGIVEFEKKYAN